MLHPTEKSESKLSTLRGSSKKSSLKIKPDSFIESKSEDKPALSISKKSSSKRKTASKKSTLKSSKKEQSSIHIQSEESSVISRKSKTFVDAS